LCSGPVWKARIRKWIKEVYYLKEYGEINIPSVDNFKKKKETKEKKKQKNIAMERKKETHP